MDSSVFQMDSSVLNLGSTQNVEISSVFYGIRNTLICPSQNVRCLLLVVIEDNILNSNNHVSKKTKSNARVFFFSLIISLYQERPRCFDLSLMATKRKISLFSTRRRGETFTPSITYL